MSAPAPKSAPKAAPKAAFDDSAIARAEAALKALSQNFQEWMTIEVDKLEAARANARAANWSEETLKGLHQSAHDVKGLGSTYDYPLVTAISAQLCRLLETGEGRQSCRENPGVANAHVDAVRAIVRGQLRGEKDPTALALLAALKAQVDRWAKAE